MVTPKHHETVPVQPTQGVVAVGFQTTLSPTFDGSATRIVISSCSHEFDWAPRFGDESQGENCDGAEKSSLPANATTVTQIGATKQPKGGGVNWGGTA